MFNFISLTTIALSLLTSTLLSPNSFATGKYESEMKCLRELEDKSGFNTLFPFGKDSFIALTGAEFWTEKYKKSSQGEGKWIRDYGGTFILSNGHDVFYGVLPPYSDSSFSTKCNSTDGTYTLISVLGSRYFVKGGLVAGSFQTAYDYKTKAILNGDPTSPVFNECMYNLGFNQAVGYFNLIPELKKRGVAYIPMKVETKNNKPSAVVIETQPATQELLQRFEDELVYKFSQHEDLYRKYNFAVKAAIAARQTNFPASDSIFSSLPETCYSANLFLPAIEKAMSAIETCQKSYPRLHWDCEQ